MVKRIILLLSAIQFFLSTTALQAQVTNPKFPYDKPVRLNLAILLFDGVEIIDFTGPYEVFDYVRWNGPVFNIYTVAEKGTTIKTAGGMSVNPNYSFDNSPKPDLVVVPGGNINPSLNNVALIKWIQDKARDAEVVMSVCNGAWILGKAGLLDGLQATTTASAAWSGRFQEFVPKAKTAANRRFVDAGKIVTTAGLSSGIDGALHVIEKLFGRGVAQDVALKVEYNWQPNANYVRAQLADMNFNTTYRSLLGEINAIPIKTEGGPDRWESKLVVSRQYTPQGLLAYVDSMLSTTQQWQKQEAKSSPGAPRSVWSFKGKNGDDWSGSASVDPLKNEPNKLLVTLKVYCNDSR